MWKRDDLGIPSYWTLQLLGWCSFYVLVFASFFHYRHEPGMFRANTLFVVSLFAASCLLRPVCHALTNAGLPWLSLELRAFLWSLPAGIVCGLVGEGATRDIRAFDKAEWVVTSMQATVMLFLWCSLYFSIKLWQQSAHERERLLRAEAEAREAKLSALRYQLNPHFLFNSLNAVSTLVLDGDAPAATRMLAQIGELLRTTLDNEVRPETPLSEELAFTGQYLAIEQTRLGERLRVVLEIAPETLDALVPAMLLQPLVENAVRHGVSPLVEGGTIRILTKRNGAELQLSVQNSGAPIAPVTDRGNSSNGNGSGIGLANTCERLKTLYGANYKFTLETPDAGGFHVTMHLPFRSSGSGRLGVTTGNDSLSGESR
jgi:two-component system, LytTR family, sensor kinase